MDMLLGADAVLQKNKEIEMVIAAHMKPISILFRGQLDVIGVGRMEKTYFITNVDNTQKLRNTSKTDVECTLIMSARQNSQGLCG